MQVCIAYTLAQLHHTMKNFLEHCGLACLELNAAYYTLKALRMYSYIVSSSPRVDIQAKNRATLSACWATQLRCILSRVEYTAFT